MKRRLVCLLIMLVVVFIFLTGCSSLDKGLLETNQSNKTVEEDKEALYGKALIDITETNTTTNPGLDKRYEHLKKQISKILDGEKELDMVDFTRFKIELDYLKMKNYNSQKMKVIMADFMEAFAVAEKAAEDADYSGYSLSDRYYSLDSDLENIFSGESKLTVATYLQIEKGINKLGDDGYPVPNKLTELKSKLFKTVLNELESAIFEYEIPEIEEEKEVIEVVKEKEEVEKIVEKVLVKPSGPQTYVVNLIDGGFGKEKINIFVNDTIVWDNVRTGSYKIAFVIGNGECRNVKSKIFKFGESYNATFTEPTICWISDGIYTTQAMKVIVG